MDSIDLNDTIDSAIDILNSFSRSTIDSQTIDGYATLIGSTFTNLFSVYLHRRVPVKIPLNEELLLWSFLYLKYSFCL